MPVAICFLRNARTAGHQNCRNTKLIAVMRWYGFKVMAAICVCRAFLWAENNKQLELGGKISCQKEYYLIFSTFLFQTRQLRCTSVLVSLLDGMFQESHSKLICCTWFSHSILHTTLVTSASLWLSLWFEDYTTCTIPVSCEGKALLCWHITPKHYSCLIYIKLWFKM